MRSAAEVTRQFELAVDAFVERARKDTYILAVIVAGSLSNDTVWEKSDLDMIVVVRDEKTGTWGKSKAGTWGKGLALTENGVVIHAMVIPRSRLRELIEGNVQSSFMHSLIAKSKLAMTKDETIREWFDGIGRLGARDQEIQIFNAATIALPSLYKAQKWLRVKEDPHYSAVWLINVATQLAKVEVLLEGQITHREVLQQALKIEPAFFKQIYLDLQDAKKTSKSVGKVLDLVDDYLMRKKKTLFGPLLEWFAEQDAPRTATEVDTHFEKEYGVRFASMACEWLADKDVLLQVSAPVRITEKSAITFEEIAWAYDRES